MLTGQQKEVVIKRSIRFGSACYRAAIRRDVADRGRPAAGVAASDQTAHACFWYNIGGFWEVTARPFCE
jgi:hypothetical protein